MSTLLNNPARIKYQYVIGVFNRGQAVGDYQSLESHQRRVIRIHVGKRAATMVSRLAKDV